MFAELSGVGLKDDGFVADFENDDRADKGAVNGAVVACGGFASGESDDAGSKLATVDLRGISGQNAVDCVGGDGNTEGINGVATDGVDFVWV